MGYGGIVYFEIFFKNVDKVVNVIEVVIGDCIENLVQLMLLICKVEDRFEWWVKINKWKREFLLLVYKMVKQLVVWIRLQDVIVKFSDLIVDIKDRVLVSMGVG